MRKIQITITLPDQGEMTREKLFKMQYSNAHKKIEGLVTEQKLDIATEIEQFELPSLYEAVKDYKDGVPNYDRNPDEVWLTPEQFLTIMNKIKHWEQLLEWLYEFQFDIPLDMEV